MWSLDAQVLLRPASTLRFLAKPPFPSGLRIACRRPLFLTLVLGCLVSLAATGTLTARIALSSLMVWVYVPAVETAALLALIGKRRDRMPLTRAIDLFFAGHAAWTLLLIVIVGLIATVQPAHWWMILTRVAMGGMAAAIVWSAYVDFCFFRYVVEATRARAIRDVVVQRAITWLVVFSIFAAPEITPAGLAREISEAVLEVLR
jgi:hypothetical protein